MNEPIVNEWLAHVVADLDAAWSCARGPRARPDRAAYHLQQAAEKLVKAALVAHDVDPPYSHDLAFLVSRLPATFSMRTSLAALDQLTPYAAGLRYPGLGEPPPVPDTAQIDAWVRRIETLKADFERWLDTAKPEGEGA